MKARFFVLGLLLFGFSLIIASPAPTQADDGCVLNPSGVGNPYWWDKSSLFFSGLSGGSCELGIYAEVCNNDDARDKLCPTDWELWYNVRGNPKFGGTLVASDNMTVPPLESGECYRIWVPAENLTLLSGNYMFQASQVDGHPGTGVLWSDAISLRCGTVSPRTHRR